MEKTSQEAVCLKRLADIMIDLLSWCVLSQVDSSIKEKGAAKCAKEIEILEVFSGSAASDEGQASKIDNNDDELIKSLADHANSGFTWDTI